MLLDVKCCNCNEITSVKVNEDLLNFKTFRCPCCGVQLFISDNKFADIDDNISNVYLPNKINNLSLTEFSSRNGESRKR